MEVPKKRGGAREGAGRKRKSVKSIALRIPQEVVDVLAQVKSSTDFIIEAVMEKARRDGLA